MPVRIVVLDGYALNPGDLSWEGLNALGDCTVYDRTPAAETIGRAQCADVVLTNKTVLDAAILSGLPNLTYIGVLATGYNVVDTDAAAQRGIPVTNVPEYSTGAVAQLVFAHVLNFYNHVAEHGNSVRDGKWSRSADFCFWDYPLAELRGKTLGIVGMGKIGTAVAKVAVAFGMRVIACTRSTPSVVPDGVALAALDQVVEEGDVLTLHCPLTDETQGFVNADLLGRMKPGAFLVNTSRGPLIDEAALADALNRGDIAGAGLDVLSAEPPAPDCPLLTAKNCCITPHIAWATAGARKRLMETAVGNVAAFAAGERVNVVNGVQ